MIIAVYGRNVADKNKTSVKHIFEKFKEKGFKVMVHKGFLDSLSPIVETNSFETFEFKKDIQNKANFMMSIGGDGTFLDAVAIVGDSNIPIMGINTGRLGFLANTNLNEVDKSIDDLKNGNYQIGKRMLLQLETERKLFGDQNFALNDLTIFRKDSTQMITTDSYINDDFLNTYWSDGLIVATPTGSTAYSLSCGGPLVMPSSDCFVINPIAPHNLNVRPIVVSDNKTIKLTIHGRAKEFLLGLDSRNVVIYPGEELKITRANFEISVIRFKGQSFLNTLRDKLNWGADKRN